MNELKNVCVIVLKVILVAKLKATFKRRLPVVYAPKAKIGKILACLNMAITLI